MGYGVRMMTKCTYNIHHNIIGASNTKLQLTVDQFEDLEFESVSGNFGEAPEIGVNQAYMKGFFSARYKETTNYDPNSIENQWTGAQQTHK
jgi:hypothetical protein